MDDSNYGTTRLGIDPDTITCFANGDFEGDVELSKSTLGILIYILGILVIWTFKWQTLVAQLTMEADTTAMAFEKVPIDELWDFTLEIPLGIDDLKRLNDGLD